ncbi:MAG: imidazole glycerol phosphate synthase subunit HisF [Bacteroidetes bacterium]|jgi:cyclase|nr:imidazole glycerol phosphate synthase subunit HisF [Bacteroidota bacterium]MBK7638869.1 imidazole glycerol phosphate synthase subunit HisF [Bacteroidota bacterium]MBK9636158.1 imidazole glycerol phosphate synthase subunit HisF [Bacteroidota bacterium]MBL0078754.1 imidazole glycerol phosphate synthase subunit HisF [Bacteroidota bacterium]MBP7257112.1 imidazole glycerol phosphate synthase subunit HisF [Chitinophagales bacterium]
MKRVRVIPVLLVNTKKLVKTVGFDKETYIGDPINAIKIFNEKEVDELVLLDISATKNKTAPNFELIEQAASECFMPLAYGGGITNIEQIKKILYSGVEKVVINSAFTTNPTLIKEASNAFGAQSIVASIDVKKTFFGEYVAFSHSGTKKIKMKLQDYCKYVEDLGAGEIMIYSIDRDGSYKGFDTNLIQLVAKSVSIPVVATGGARNIDDFKEAINEGHASAVAAGSMFVYNGKHRAVLISYPSQNELKESLYEKIY